MFYFIFRIRFTRYKTFDTFVASCNSLRSFPDFIHENVDKFLKFCQLVYRVIEYYLYFIYFVSTKHRNNLLITKFKHLLFILIFLSLKLHFANKTYSMLFSKVLFISVPKFIKINSIV